MTIPAAATRLDTAPTDALRHRPVRLSAFPEASEVDAEAEREATALRSLLIDPLRELAQASHDPSARAIAEAALAGGVVETNDDLGRLEDALELVASTTSDASARALAEDAVTSLEKWNLPPFGRLGSRGQLKFAAAKEERDRSPHDRTNGQQHRRLAREHRFLLRGTWATRDSDRAS
jgi:hypothetical protein